MTKEEFDKEFSKYKDLEISYVGRKDYFDERYPIIDDVVYYYYFDHFEVAGADNDIKRACGQKVGRKECTKQCTVTSNERKRSRHI